MTKDTEDDEGEGIHYEPYGTDRNGYMPEQHCPYK